MTGAAFIVTDQAGDQRLRLPCGVQALVKARRAAMSLHGEVFIEAVDGTVGLLPIASFTRAEAT